MNVWLLCLKSSILLCTGPQKCDRSVWLLVKFARRWKRVFKIHHTTGHFIPKKLLKSSFLWQETIATLKSPNPRNRNSLSVIKWKFLSVSSMNTLLTILKVSDARRDVILAGGLYTFPSAPPPPTRSVTSVNLKEAGMFKKQYTLFWISFAVVFGLLVLGSQKEDSY